MKVAVVFDLRQKYAVSNLLKIAKAPCSTYYYYANKIGKADKYKSVKEKIKEIYEINQGRYGYRRITQGLHNQGVTINHITIP